jgi:hypothetical protein
MRIGVDPSSGVRGYVVADVLRRFVELRGRQADVVAPCDPGLTGLNVATPAYEEGRVDVVVRVPPALGPLPLHTLATRLVLLSRRPGEPVTVTSAALATAETQLRGWRHAVAVAAARPSAPPLDRQVTLAHDALADGVDTPAVIALVEAVLSCSTAPDGARFETVAYLDRLLALDLVTEIGKV